MTNTDFTARCIAGKALEDIAGKQDTIADLDTIRAGAAAGATAVQPTDMTTALATKQDVLTTEQLAATNSGITSTDVAQIETNKNNISTITPALQECVDNGVKNLLDFSGSTPVVPPDCTMTDNGDGTYTVTKSSSDLGILYIAAQIKAGTYIFSGCPAGGSVNTYRLDIRTTTDNVIGSDYGSGINITIPSDGSYRITCRLASTYTTTGLIIKPMLCDPDLWAVSPTFKPYAMSNTEITAWILAHS